ncbi:MAG: primosomal protein N' [Firmicutes bacterium]|nr:primosomal protein N' [Bacillota bacterium]
MMESRYASIAIDVHHQKVDRVYTYVVPDTLAGTLRIGHLVEVPFGIGDKPKRGYVLEIQTEPPEDVKDSLDKLKTVIRLVSEEVFLREEDIELAREMASCYMAPLSSCLSLFLPKQPGKALKEPKDRRSKKENAPPEVIPAGFVSSASAESATAESAQENFPEQGAHQAKEEDLPLNQQQLDAFTSIHESMEKGAFEEFLLYGITGSGKTEVYMRCIKEALKAQKTCILLVPEISLTPQLMAVFERRFAGEICITHSRLTDKQRSLVWHQARSGKARVMIGPRSALFMPMPDLGLVILDEEHESSYRSEQMAPHYHARQVAEMICKKKQIPLVLGSATPSLESYYRAKQGEIRLLTLDKRAISGASLPETSLVDMRAEMQSGNMGIFSARLVEGMKKRLDRGEQTILFLNRKGYSTFMNCRSCGFVLKCPRCYLPYTYHKEKDSLICHHCGKVVSPPRICPNCHSMHIRQFGVGTEKVEEEAARLFPDARILRMDMGTMKKREDYQQVYETFRKGEGDILIGTQMVSKGFDFPKVTLVGVIAADMTLYNADFHSTERTFQLLVQVAGRAGRAKSPGEVLIQTFSPEHYCLKKAKDQDYPGFYQNEIAARKLMECPPFTHLAQIVVMGKDEEKSRLCAERLLAMMEPYAKIRPFEILGPSPAQLKRINNVFRWKILVKCPEEQRLRAFSEYIVRKFQSEEPLSLAITLQADIDPMAII